MNNATNLLLTKKKKKIKNKKEGGELVLVIGDSLQRQKFCDSVKMHCSYSEAPS